MADEIIITNAITLVAGFGGAILGSLVSGWVTRSQMGKAKFAQQKAELFKVMIKSSLIHSDFINLNREIRASVETGNKNGLGEMPDWAKVQANPGDFEKIAITPDDLVCLFEAREFQLLSDMVAIGMKHSRTFDAFNTYSRLRSELKDHMPKHGTNGPVVSSNLSKDDLLRLQPRFLELSSLLDSVQGLLPRYIQESKSINDRLGPAARKYFDDPKFPVLEHGE